MTTTEVSYDRVVVNYGGKPTFALADWKTMVIDDGNRRAVKALQSLEWNGRGAYLFGSPGTGKSFLMKAKFNDVVRWKMDLWQRGEHHPGGPFWARFSDIMEQMRAEKPDLKKKAVAAQWLFLDDLGTGTTTEWAIDQIFQILDERIEMRKQTFITSNFSLEELAGHYSQRISSRVAELCNPIPLKGQDRRMLNLLAKK